MKSQRVGAARASHELELLDRLPDGVIVVSKGGSIVYANRQIERLTGYRRMELLGQTMELLVPQRLRSSHRKHRRAYTSHPRRRPMGRAERDFLLRRKDGSELVVDIALGPIGRPQEGEIAAVIRDASDRKRLEADLEHRALHDPLTDLANRNLFFDRLNQALLATQRNRQPSALVMLDLNRFKSVNDAFGHVTGDAILRQVAAKLQSGLRATDTVARIGGDEFAWILPGIGSLNAAARKVRALLRAMPRRYSVGGKRIEIGISAGLALFPDDGDTVDALMRGADVALYRAKRQGLSLALVGQQAHRIGARKTRP
ncbi:MAG TPA: sensor domain-containing diguanylate cyclase [Candidatus Dormibacteraeota bacterium]